MVKNRKLSIPQWLKKISNATIKAAIAENPAVATASGWTINNGEAQQNATEDPGVKQLQKNLAVLGGTATGIVAAPLVATHTAAKLVGDAAASMLGGETVNQIHKKITGQPFGRGMASLIGQQNTYDNSPLARFGYDILNPGYLAGGLVGKGVNAGIDAAGKALKTVDNTLTIGNALRTGKLKFGKPTVYEGIHQSFTPLTEAKFPYPRWDVTTHGADPNGFWLTLADKPNTTGTMGSRPFASRWTATAEKPLIQTGEVKSLFGGKNNTRNAIVKYGRRKGADAFEFKGIRDNALPQTDVVMLTDRTNPLYRGGMGQVKYAGPTTGKTTFIKANPNYGYVDLDAVPEYKALRKEVANKLGLDYRDPKVTNSPEYQQEFNKLISKWSQDVNNSGKTLYGSSKALLRSGLPLDNEPFIPDFETFVARNQARGFKENPEQLKAWYNSIIESYPNIKIDNKFISEDKLLETEKAWQRAIEAGDMESAQRMRDLHFKLKAEGNRLVDAEGNPHKVWHGSPKDWNIFDDSKRHVDDVIYFSTDKSYADQYTIPRIYWDKGMKPTKSSRSFYLYGKEPINAGDEMYYDTVQDELRRAWMNGQEADSIYGLDAWNPNQPLKKSNGMEFGVLRRPQAKLTDPITYDDAGKMIPLSKRDDFKNPDIRYGLIPLAGGLGLGTLKINKNDKVQPNTK